MKSLQILIFLGTTLLVAGCQTAPKPPERPIAPPNSKPVSQPTSIRDLLPPNDEVPTAVTVASQKQWELLFVGDILLAGSAAPVVEKFGYARPFSHYTEIIRSADLAYGNLEAPVGRRGKPIESKTYTFQMHPQALTSLTDIGFDVYHLANNHILDFGELALSDTYKHLSQNSAAYCGAGDNADAARQPALVELKNGMTVAFVCYSNTFPESFWATDTAPGTAFGHEAWVREDVANAVEQYDIVIAAFHWGAELATQPKDYQVTLATAAVEAGATAVIGHHPHVLQPVSLIAGSPAAYSLGNFVFGSYSKNVRHSALLRLRGHEASIEEIAVLPIDVYNPRVNFHPRDLPHDQAAEVAAFLLGPEARQDGRWWVLTPTP